MVNASVTHKGKNQRVRQSKFDIQSPGNLRKPLGARASRPHHLEKCGLEARVPGKKRGFRRLPLEIALYFFAWTEFVQLVQKNLSIFRNVGGFVQQECTRVHRLLIKFMVGVLVGTNSAAL